MKHSGEKPLYVGMPVWYIPVPAVGWKGVVESITRILWVFWVVRVQLVPEKGEKKPVILTDIVLSLKPPKTHITLMERDLV